MALRQKSAKLRLGGVALPQTFTNAFPSTPTVGQTVFFTCNHYGGSPITGVTIAGAVAELDRIDQPYSEVRIYVWRAVVPASPTRHVVLSGSGSDHYITGGACEVDALASTPLDAVSPDDFTDYAVGAGNNVSVSTSGATTQADELVIAQWTPSFGASDIGTDTASGYTELWVEDDSNSYQGGAGGFKFVSATGVQSATWPINQAGTYYAQIVTYKLATASGNTATAAITLGDVVAAGSATVANAATGSVTADVVAAGSASLTNIGSAAITLGDVVASGAGVSSNNANAAITLDDVLASGSATVANVATGDVTADVSATGEASLTNVGVADIALDDVVASGAGVSSNNANAAITLDDVAVAGDATTTNVGFADIAVDDVVASGSEGGQNNGSAAITLDDVVASGSAVLTNVANGAVTADVVAAGTAMLTNVAAAELLLADVLASGSGQLLVPNEANAAINVGDVLAAGAASLTNVGSGAATVADVIAQGFGAQYEPAEMLIEITVDADVNRLTVAADVSELIVDDDITSIEV